MSYSTAARRSAQVREVRHKLARMREAARLRARAVKGFETQQLDARAAARLAKVHT